MQLLQFSSVCVGTTVVCSWVFFSGAADTFRSAVSLLQCSNNYLVWTLYRCSLVVILLRLSCHALAYGRIEKWCSPSFVSLTSHYNFSVCLTCMYRYYSTIGGHTFEKSFIKRILRIFSRMCPFWGKLRCTNWTIVTHIFILSSEIVC